ncbi:hypothetical protein OF83DRAFT_1080803 [Amylostereum chailletii]|nr:hypothetical protein OF83DRAFT_1080803 [Amylostereum chailletii]
MSPVFIHYLTGSKGDDWLVIVWASSRGKILQTFNPELGPVTSIELFSHGLDQWLFLAGASGCIQLRRKMPGERCPKVSFEHTVTSAVLDLQVEAMALSDSHELLAVVGGGRLAILRINWDGTPSLAPAIRHPGIAEAALPSLACSVFFFNDDRSIMVGYLDSKQIGSMSWSSETRHLLIWNLDNGVDLYQLHEDGQLRYLRKLRVKVKRNFVKLVALVQHGRLAVSGTDKGEVNLWDTDSGVLVQTLIHGSGTEIIQIVVGHTRQFGSYQLAGVSMSDRPEVKIWVASSNYDDAKPPPWKVAAASVTTTFLLIVMIVWALVGWDIIADGLRKL